MAITENQIKIQRIIHRYRYKYAGDRRRQDQLDRIIWDSYNVVYGDTMMEAHKKLMALCRKKQRIQKRINDMQLAYYHLYFITLTLDDDLISDLNEKQIHKAASSWFNDNCRDFIANSDHGDHNGRLHFHGVAALLEDKSNVVSWAYGHSYIEPIRSPKDSPRLSWYLGKLTNHAGKLSAGRIFSKRGALKEVDEIPFC